jgi:hypothetical protein
MPFSMKKLGSNSLIKITNGGRITVLNNMKGVETNLV